MVQTTSQKFAGRSLRRLKEAGSSISIAKDREFVNSRKVLQ